MADYSGLTAQPGPKRPPQHRYRRAAEVSDGRALDAIELTLLFAARGFQAVTLAEVADAAEVVQRTVFRYFADKEELLFGDDPAVQAHLGAALAARPAQEPPAAAVLEAVVSLALLWQDDRDQGRIRRAGRPPVHDQPHRGG
jgi:AcrR family transcriptional regulator